MVWTISNAGAITYVFPDGTSDADFATLLDAAISASVVGISKPAPFVYLFTADLLIASDPGGTNFLYMSGVTLVMNNKRFIRDRGSRIKFTDVNAAGVVVGRFSLVSNTSTFNAYNYNTLSPFTVGSGSGSPAYIEATALDFVFHTTNTTVGGAVMYGYDIGAVSSGFYNNCTFIAANAPSNNQICYLDSNTYTNCTFKGFDAIELTLDTLLFGVNFGQSTVKNYLFLAYFEQCLIYSFTVQSGNSCYFTDCPLPTVFRTDGHPPRADLFFRNSLEMLGGASEATGKLVVRTTGNTQVYKRTANGTGKIAGGNVKGETDGVASSSERLLILGVVNSPANVLTPDYRGTFEGVFVKYGRSPVSFTYNIQGTLATKQAVPFSTSPDTGITVTNTATVAAYTEFAIAHSTSLVTISSTTTLRRLHDYSALEKTSFANSGITLGGNPVAICCLPTLDGVIYDRVSGLFSYNLSIAADITGLDSLIMADNKNVTTSTAGNYSATPITMGAGGVVTVPSGNSILQGWLGVGNTINAVSGSATVFVDNVAQWVAGIGVTLSSPLPVITITTNPPGARVGIYRQSDNLQIINANSNGTTGVATATYSGSVPTNVVIYIRLAGYQDDSSVQQITAAGLTLSIALPLDPIYNPSY